MPLSHKSESAALGRESPYKPKPPQKTSAGPKKPADFCLKYAAVQLWPLAAIIFQLCLKINKNILMKNCCLFLLKPIAF